MAKSAKSAKLLKVGTGVAVALGTAASASLAARRRRTPNPARRWLVVTVNTTPDQVTADGRLDKAVAGLDADVETRVTPAPGLRGTEVAVRLRTPEQGGLLRRARGKDPRQEVRRALRNLKSVVETGEVMRPDSPPVTGKPTPGGKLIRFATRRAGGEGRL